MKRKLLLITLCLSVFLANAQDKQWNGTTTPWAYDLTGTRAVDYTSQYILKKAATATGYTAEGDVTTSGTTSYVDVPGWFPAPASAGCITDIGCKATVQVRAATAAQVAYSLIKEGADIKSLKIDATNGLGKFIIRNIDNTKATAVAKYSFNLKTHYKDGGGNVVTPGYVRDYYLTFGHNDGLTATNALGSVFRDGNHAIDQTFYTKQAIFAGLKLSYVVGQSGLSLTNRKVLTPGTGTSSANDVNGTLEFTPIAVAINANGTDSAWEIYCNNSSSAQYYVVDNVNYTVLSKTFHLWINGISIGQYDIAATSTVAAATMDAGKILNTFMVYTTGATGLEEIGYGSIELSNFNVDYVSTTTLPVSLAAFTGNYNGNAVKLNWKTLSEKDNSHFEVLRSGDGHTFSEIARVSGAGNSDSPINYTTTDYNLLEGTNYYMLKQVDKNGDHAMSKVIGVNTSITANGLKVIKKDGALEVYLYSTTSSAINVYVTDVNGRKLYSQKVQASVGKNQFSVALPSLASGVYVLSVEGNGEAQRIKFVN